MGNRAMKNIVVPAVDMRGKVVVVTGATSGLGLSSAKYLSLLNNAHVVMAVREYVHKYAFLPYPTLPYTLSLALLNFVNAHIYHMANGYALGDTCAISVQKGEQVKNDLLQQFRDNQETVLMDRISASSNDLTLKEGYTIGDLMAPEIDVVHLDLASLDTVRTFPDRLHEKGIEHVDVLMNNAAVALLPEYTQTVDGFETQFQTNHLAPFLLTHQLIDMMDCSDDAEMVLDPKIGEKIPFFSRTSRIINTTCKAHRFGRITHDWNIPEKYRPSDAYANSKLANVVFTYELQRRVQELGILVNCCDPGVAKTNIRRYSDATMDPKQLNLAYSIFQKLGSMQSAEQASKLQTYVAVSPDIDGLGGNFYSRDIAPTLSGKESYRAGSADELWDLSMDALKLE